MHTHTHTYIYNRVSDANTRTDTLIHWLLGKIADILQQTIFSNVLSSMKTWIFWKVIELCSLESNWKWVVMGLDTGLALFRGQAIVCINVYIVYPRIYASADVTKLSIMLLYDRSITETEMLSGWLPLSSLGMMTSSSGNIFRVTGHLFGEFTSPRWIPRTKASDAELWCFIWSASEYMVE